MRTFILFALSIAALAAADVETFHLKDGRTLTGIYDEDKQIISVKTGKLTADLPLKKWDIKSREPFEAPETNLVPITKPAQKNHPNQSEQSTVPAANSEQAESLSTLRKKMLIAIAEKNAAVEADEIERLTVGIELDKISPESPVQAKRKSAIANFSDLLKKYDKALGADFSQHENLLKEAESLRQRADREYVAEFRAWFKAGNYKPSNIPMSSDPRDSERSKKQRESEYNRLIQSIRNNMESPAATAENLKGYRSPEDIALLAEFSEP